MHIVLLCATRRGYRFLERLSQLAPGVRITVFSFPEEPWEPRFLADIRDLAGQIGAEFHETRNVTSKDLTTFWDDNKVDAMFAVSWRYLLPATIFLRPRLGTYIFHDSLLPGYRGFSPTVWAIMNGENLTGVTLFRMVEEVDSGSVLDQEPVPIANDDTIADVLDRVTDTYLRLLEANLHDILEGRARLRPQVHARATYCCKLLPQDCEIDWRAPSERIYNLIRAYTSPYPGAFTMLGDKKLTVWSANVDDPTKSYVGRVPGRVVSIDPDMGALVLTGDGQIWLREVQIEDQARVPASTVINRLSQTLGC